MSQGLNSSFRLPRASFQAQNLRRRPATTMGTVSTVNLSRATTGGVGDLNLSRATSGGVLAAPDLKSFSRTLNLPGLDRSRTELNSPKPSRKALGHRPSNTVEWDAQALSRKAPLQRSAVTVEWSQERTNAVLAHERDFILNYTPPKSPFSATLARAGANEFRPFSPPKGTPKGTKEFSPMECMDRAQAQSLPNLHKPARPDSQQFKNIAQAINLPRDQIKSAYDLFRKHIECSDVVSSAKEVRLSKTQFAKLLCTMTDCNNEDELPTGLVDEAFASAGRNVGGSPTSGRPGTGDQDSGGGIDFGQFALWYATNSFSESLNLNAGQRALRELARKYSLPYEQVDQYKQNFDKFDVDKSGMIESGEFPDLLCKCAKIPEHGLSHVRMKQLWHDADADGSGEVDFEEFMCFYRKYFDLKDSDRAGFENFYRGVRNHAWKH